MTIADDGETKVFDSDRKDNRFFTTNISPIMKQTPPMIKIIIKRRSS